MKLDLNDLKAVCLLADYTDSERCLAIYSAPMAAERPEAAWLILPLGLDVKRSLGALAKVPVEADATPGMYAHNLGLLRFRRDAALQAWQAYTNQGASKNVH